MARIKGWSVVFKGIRTIADVVAASLQADGIEAQVFEDAPYGTILEAQVLVPEGQASRALRIIEEAENAPPEEEGV